MKLRPLNIFENSKNQILYNCTVEEKSETTVGESLRIYSTISYIYSKTGEQKKGSRTGALL